MRVKGKHTIQRRLLFPVVTRLVNFRLTILRLRNFPNTRRTVVARGHQQTTVGAQRQSIHAAAVFFAHDSVTATSALVPQFGSTVSLWVPSLSDYQFLFDVDVRKERIGKFRLKFRYRSAGTNIPNAGAAIDVYNAPLFRGLARGVTIFGGNEEHITAVYNEGFDRHPSNAAVLRGNNSVKHRRSRPAALRAPNPRGVAPANGNNRRSIVTE